MRSMFAYALMAGAVVTAAPSLGAEETTFGKDLKATIALNGMPCDQVIETQRKADSDYLAVCKDGHRYHVYVSPEGRVVVEQLAH